MNTITISNKDSWWDSQWTMDIDLDDVAHNAGRRTKDNDGCIYTVYPIPRAKKLLKLIRKYGTEEDFEKVTAAMKNNDRLSDYWDSLQ